MADKLSKRELARRNANLVYNIEKLIELTGTSTRSFFDYAGGFGKSTYYTCAKNKTYVPKYDSIEPIATKFQTTVDVLLNEKLPDNFCVNPMKVFRTAIINANEDTKIAELLEAFYTIDFATIFKIFAKQNYAIEFMVSPDIMLIPDIRTLRPSDPSLKKQYNDAYSEDKLLKKFLEKEKSTPIRIKKKLKNRVAKYKDYYLPILERKLTFINAFELLSEKGTEEIFNYISVRIKTPKMQMNPDDDITSLNITDYDLYETVKTISLENFIDFCERYYNQVNDILKE